MRKSVSFEIEISNYLLLSTGADGGHHYISVDIEYKGQSRKLVAYFYDKNDEEKLLKKPHLKIQGDLIDEGMQYSLSLYNTIIVEEL